MNSQQLDAASVELAVRTYPIENPKSNTLAYASVNIGGLVAIGSIRVVNHENGAFVAMPQEKDATGKYRDVAFPILHGLRGRISAAVLESYAAEKEKAAPEKASVRERIRENAAAKAKVQEAQSKSAKTKTQAR
jgi:DNA-binding cell septation regulator SpoVG